MMKEQRAMAICIMDPSIATNMPLARSGDGLDAQRVRVIPALILQGRA